MVESGDNASHVLAVSKTGGVYVWGLNNQGQLGDQTTDNSPYPVVVGSSPVSLDSKVLRLHPTDEADVTATSSATVFSLFNTSTTTTSEVTWRILNPNIAEIVSSTPSAATGGLTSTTVKVRGLKTGSTVLIATDSLTLLQLISRFLKDLQILRLQSVTVM